MKYIEELIHYIDDNIENIEWPEHNLHLHCRVYVSKLEKDFENYMGFTLNSYLEQRKKEQNEGQKEMQMEKSKVSRRKKKSLKTINISLPEEVREQFMETIPFILNLPNRSIFAEIFVRLILLLKEAKPQFKDTKCTILLPMRLKISYFSLTLILLLINYINMR